MSNELDQLHRDASSHYLKGEYNEAIVSWQQVLELQPEDERAREGIRLCEQMAQSVDVPPPEIPQPAAGATAAPAIDDDHPEFDLCDPDEESDASEAFEESIDASPALPLDEAAASELQRRTQTLLREARELVDRGDAKAARQTLDRVLILDEENEAALSLKRTLQASEPPDPAPVLELDQGPLAGVAGKQPASKPFQVSGSDALPPAQVAGSISELLGSPESQPTPDPTPTPGASHGLSYWVRDRRVQLGLGGLLVIAAAFAGMRLTGGGDGPSLEPLNAVAHGSVIPTALPANPAPPANPAAPEPAPAPPGPETMMEQAAAAFETGDYAAAVIAYDRLLKQFPDHPEAAAKLKVAAQHFKEQEEKQQRWEEAVGSFEKGLYGESLRLLYRMRDEDYDADLVRMRVNGWYNLGVSALKSNDCPRAEENFKEALGINGADRGALAGLELAEVCRGPDAVAQIKKFHYRLMTD